ncbi:MAG: SUMF1/EgtB/PvdO family nonheme iron enzyme [Bacteroidetes bacterium]|nr:SUMF1/EgtB/PvdO family nonheme iron enzyme [Bacteroidota bacterium]
MKPFYLILSGLMLTQLNFCFSQNSDPSDPKGTTFAPTGSYRAIKKSKNFIAYDPKGTTYVHTGSYRAKKNNADTATSLISVQSFFITNEITNKEYREFTDYANSHLNDSIMRVELGEKTPTRNFKIISHTYKEIIKSLIDSTAMAKEYSDNSEMHNKYKNYFTDKKFDNYPVVGVSYNAARYYCIWKTTQEEENKILKKKGQSVFFNFRVPLIEESDYVSSISANSEASGAKAEVQEVQEVKSGKPNQRGLYNLSGNVSEWTSSPRQSG